MALGKRHVWIKNSYDDSPDVFAFEAGEYHNGPRCSVCDYGFCEHCFPEGWESRCGATNLPTVDDSKLNPIVVARDRSVRRGEVFR